MSRHAIARPGDAIGILGGGQLGRMLAMAAARLGLDVHIFTPERDSPASRVAARTFVAPYEDGAALMEFSRGIKAATIEFENVPTEAVDALLAVGVPTRPDSRSLAIAQDRLAEKTFLKEIGVEPAPFIRIDAANDIAPALEKLGGRAILKTRTAGYDGKGQVRLFDPARAEWAFSSIGGRRAVLEALIDFESELSVIVARGADGEVSCYDPPDNLHADGVLRRSTFPSTASAEIRAAAIAKGRLLAEELEYVGVLALELFLTRDGRLIANEFAPRVHNSGHWTADACRTGQFEQHIRAVCGWPLGDVTRHSDGEMENLLGEEAAAWETLADEDGALNLYGKRETKPGRKMGHVTRLKPRA